MKTNIKLIIIIALLATAYSGAVKIGELRGTGIAFDKHYMLTTAFIARQDSSRDSILVIVNGAAYDARVEKIDKITIDVEKKEYVNLAVIQIDNSVDLNACRITDEEPVSNDSVNLIGYMENGSPYYSRSFQAKIVTDSTFPTYIAGSVNVIAPGGFSGAAVEKNGSVIGMLFSASNTHEASFFHPGKMLNHYIAGMNEPTTDNVGKCTYQVRSYTTIK